MCGFSVVSMLVIFLFVNVLNIVCMCLCGVLFSYCVSVCVVCGLWFMFM